MSTGLGLTAAVAITVAATWMFLGISRVVLASEELALLSQRDRTDVLSGVS